MNLTTNMVYDLKGKIVLITGGASGIGFRSVKELLRNGVQGVTIAEINAEKGDKAIKELTQEFGANRVIFVKTDVTKVDQLEAAFKATVESWKSIDIVINNAGIMNDGQWELEIALNCNAVVQGMLLGLQYMGKDKGGKGGIIVNMASTLGLQPVAYLPIYAGTKHFVIGLSRSFAEDYHYKRTGVKILSLCPGGTDTTLLTEAVRLPLNITPTISQDLAKALADAPIQSTENVATAIVKLITKGENGGVWVAEAGKPAYELHIPHRTTFERSQTA